MTKEIYVNNLIQIGTLEIFQSIESEMFMLPYTHHFSDYAHYT